MARIEIKKRHDAPKNTINTINYDVTIDGKNIDEILSGVTNINLDLQAGEIPIATISMHADVFIDSDFKIDGSNG